MQALQQLKFRLVIGFLKPLSGIQSRYFGSASGSKSKGNLYHQRSRRGRSRCTGTCVQQGADHQGRAGRLPERRCCSQGGEPHHPYLAGQFRAGQCLGYGQGGIVCYSESLGTFEIFESAAVRSALSAEVELPDYHLGKEVHVWAYFSNTGETSASNSAYLGTLTMI